MERRNVSQMDGYEDLDCYDVIVVGAGFAGLADATELEANGRTVQVIEAGDRIGGRVWSVEGNDGRPLELGGQFINTDMHKILAHLEKAGCHLSTVPSSGAPAAFIDGTLSAMVVEDPFTLLQQMGTPGLHQSVGDAISAAELSATQRTLVHSMSCELLCSDPFTVNALATLQHAARYKSKRCDMEFQVTEGLSVLARHLAASLGRAPVMNTPASAIFVEDGRVTIHTSNGVWTGRFCILAMSPPVAKRVVVTPSWRPNIAEALASFRVGAVIKTVVSYAAPFWNAHGWSGYVQFAEPAGMLVVDGSCHEGVARLVVFQGGPAAHELYRFTPSQREAKLIARLVAAFGPEASAFTACREAVWKDDVWCGGGYVARVKSDGQSDAARHLREASGHVLLACSEIADHFPGFVEGAIAAGEHAATQIVQYLTATDAFRAHQ